MMLKIMTLLPDLRGGSGQQLMSLPLHLHLLLYQGELIGKLTVAASQNKGVSYKISAQCAHDKKKEQHADLEEKRTSEPPDGTDNNYPPPEGKTGR